MHRRDDEPFEANGPDREEPAPRRGAGPWGVLAAIAIVLLVVFAALNFRPVRVNFLLFSTRARVVTVIAVAAALGFVVGYFVGRPSREDRRRLRELRGRKGDDRES